ncbi:MAG: LuxR C-terminal-related transcriptional regulator [Candidatus Obscuribacterales bacterium]|nr:LuxR C-terminal-related transcriptional regulator [Candidatus Obscuribacterales bacterium]
MTYREATLQTSADSTERIALLLSKQQDRAALATALFAELTSSSAASHAVVWRKDSKTDKLFFPDLASCPVEKDEALDPSNYGFWDLWKSGKENAYLIESPNSIVHRLWTRFNLLIPLQMKGKLEGIFSLHFTSEPENQNFFCPSLSEIIVNSLLLEKSGSERSNQLAHELWLERQLRHIMSRIHASLERDVLLQSAVDALGSIMRAGSCMILKNEGGIARISHDYIDPSMSPLGLGPSYAIPQIIAVKMWQQTTVLEETGINAAYASGDLHSENTVQSLAGTPIMLNMECYGALVVQNHTERSWKRHEIMLLEKAAACIGQALKNSQAYEEAREQLFNLSQLSHLVSTLNESIDEIGRHGTAPTEETSTIQPQTKLPLSARELEVLKLIASGLANREIAQRLFLTESTVELHASRIRKKLKLKSRTALVKFACDNHLV